MEKHTEMLRRQALEIAETLPKLSHDPIPKGDKDLTSAYKEELNNLSTIVGMINDDKDYDLREREIEYRHDEKMIELDNQIDIEMRKEKAGWIDQGIKGVTVGLIYGLEQTRVIPSYLIRWLLGK